MNLRLLPCATALDGSLMVGVSRETTAATGMGALTHAVEAFVSRNALKKTDDLALEAIKIIMSDLELVVEDGGKVDARHRMARTSYLAGKTFTQVGVGYVHAIAHTFGALYHLAARPGECHLHALCAGVFLTDMRQPFVDSREGLLPGRRHDQRRAGGSCLH